MAAEKNFENKIKGFLKDHGCWFLKYWGGAAYTKSGIPDILACCNGKFLGIEVKAKNGKPSELQLYNLKKDPQEKKNLSESNVKRVKKMKLQMDKIVTSSNSH